MLVVLGTGGRTFLLGSLGRCSGCGRDLPPTNAAAHVCVPTWSNTAGAEQKIAPMGTTA